ncbi:hypothetical protein SAMN05443667_104159 [Flavobacterium gillisiae]|uniref:Uncharacterized protein n=1 Tax=Flavobacterium gillisiae TaxID=150146 RepID=A0A1H4B2E7_9FLAO|nr:hypothetical protein SAMN05443667_104159 [Flavobacterium gillisiae]
MIFSHSNVELSESVASYLTKENGCLYVFKNE